MGEAEDPRARLAALADAGRAQREAERIAQEHAEKQEAARVAKDAQRHERLMSFTTWSSLSWWMHLLWWAMFLPFLPMFLVLIVGMRAWLLYGSLAASAALVIAALLGTAWARRQDIAFRAALPFAILGYEALLGTRARSVRCDLEFQGARPPPEMFADLLRSLRAPTELVESSDTGLRIEAEALDYSLLDEHCRWVPPWFLAFTKQVLLPVHAVYPIRSLTLR